MKEPIGIKVESEETYTISGGCAGVVFFDEKGNEIGKQMFTKGDNTFIAPSECIGIKFIPPKL